MASDQDIKKEKCFRGLGFREGGGGGMARVIFGESVFGACPNYSTPRTCCVGNKTHKLQDQNPGGFRISVPVGFYSSSFIW